MDISIFSVEDNREIKTTDAIKELLVDEGLIRYNYKSWLYFKEDTPSIIKVMSANADSEVKFDDSWLDLTLQQIIDEYKCGSEDEPLDADNVDDLALIIKAKINLQEGNLTFDEYNKILK